MIQTTVSLPDELFEATEQFAKYAGLSRSELVVLALYQYLQAQRTQHLNGTNSQESTTLNSHLAYVQWASLSQDEW